MNLDYWLNTWITTELEKDIENQKRKINEINYINHNTTQFLNKISSSIFIYSAVNKRNLFFPKFDVFIVANKQDEKCFYEAIENLNNN